jgi:hypothetical protein
MDKDTGQIREEIEEAREHMGETLEALGDKADVKGRAKGAIVDKRDQLRDKVSGVTSRAGDATPDAEQMKQGARQAVGIAQENPIGLALGGMAAGFLAGMLIPSTRMEQERVGPIADQVKERAKETGQEAVERGKQVAQDALETAKEKGQEQAQELGSSAQDKARETAEQARAHATS